MNGLVRAAWIVARVILHVVVAFALVGLVLPWRAPLGRQSTIRWWSRRLLTISGVTLRVVESPQRATTAGTADGTADAARIDRALAIGGGGAMIVLNHVSWLDIFVVHAMRPARFVAKAEIGRWPLLGYLVDRTGAVFVERGKRHAVREVNHRVSTLLADGALIGLFPEGGVGDGGRLLPFHANLIQPAIDARVPIVVAGLRYRDADGRRASSTHYVGSVTLLRSLVRIARGGPLLAELHLIEMLDGGASTRHALARRARAAIAAALDFDDEAEETVEGLSTVVVAVDDRAFSRDAALAGTAPGTALDPRDELL